MRCFFCLVLPFSLALAACSWPSGTGTAAPSPTSPLLPATGPSNPPLPIPGSSCTAATWSVDFTRSGGLAGKVATFHLTSSGSGIAARPDQKLTLSTQVAPASLVQVGQLLEAACPFLSSSKPNSCPDCFTYVLQIQMDGNSFSARATDVDLAGLGPLIQSLSTILDQSLAGHS